jgi:hypothetical protein
MLKEHYATFCRISSNPEWDLLFLVAGEGTTETMRLLLSLGAKPDGLADYMITYILPQCSNLKNVEALLSHSARPEATDRRRRTASTVPQKLSTLR